MEYRPRRFLVCSAEQAAAVGAHTPGTLARPHAAGACQTDSRCASLAPERRTEGLTGVGEYRGSARMDSFTVIGVAGAVVAIASQLSAASARAMSTQTVRDDA